MYDACGSAKTVCCFAGTSIVMSPDNDAPEIAKDDKRVNNFQFDQSDTQQRGCPFAAHMRKSNPRNDVPESEQLRHLYVEFFYCRRCSLYCECYARCVINRLFLVRIRRHNMPYGPEVDPEEKENGTLAARGLHLCAYQSSIERGFRHIQRGESLVSCRRDTYFTHSCPDQPGTTSHNSLQTSRPRQAWTPSSVRPVPPTLTAP